MREIRIRADLARAAGCAPPPSDWPVWALVVALFAQPKDRGIGDTLRREVGGPKTERFKRWHEAMFGLWSTPCGCGKLARWNQEYPYEAGTNNEELSRH